MSLQEDTGGTSETLVGFGIFSWVGKSLGVGVIVVISLFAVLGLQGFMHARQGLDPWLHPHPAVILHSVSVICYMFFLA